MDIREAVLKTLQSQEASEDTRDLWNDILDWYEEGGPDLVKVRILELGEEVQGRGATP